MSRPRNRYCLLAVLAVWALAAVHAGPGHAVVKGQHAPHRIVTPRFVLEFTVPHAMGSTYADLCEKAYAKFRRKFHVSESTPVWRGKCHVYLFADRGQFVRFAALVHKTPKGVSSGGYTRIRNPDPEIALFLHQNNHILLQQTLVHEMTHVFLQLFHKRARLPMWLHEGCAQFFEFQHHPEKSRLDDSKRLIKALVARNRHRPLAQFWTLDFAPTDRAAYAQAWSLVDFLINATTTSSKRTSKFILLLKNGRSQTDALAVAFGVDLARLEAVWKAHVLSKY